MYRTKQNDENFCDFPVEHICLTYKFY